VGDTEHDLRSTVARKRSSMKAIVQDKYGSAEVLELRDIDKPEIGDGEVLARVRAAEVNPGDWAIMSGLPYVARAEQAAAVPMAGLVALQALRDHGNIRAGQRVLINGASGDIGTFAVQISRAHEVVAGAVPPTDARNTSTAVSLHLYSRAMRPIYRQLFERATHRRFRDFYHDGHRTRYCPDSPCPRASRLLVRSGVPLLLDHLTLDLGDRKSAQYRGALSCHEPGGAE
jgi:hypothetical protein